MALMMSSDVKVSTAERNKSINSTDNLVVDQYMMAKPQGGET